MRAEAAAGLRREVGLRCLPPAVLAAIVAPTVLAMGPAETLAALVTALAARRAPLVATVGVGVVAVVSLRAVLR